MSPTRRQVVNAIAAGAVVPVTVASAEAQDNQEFSPDITISPNNLVATIGERDGDVDPDTVTVVTADGESHPFDGAAEDDWEAGGAFDVGYTHDESRARIDGWHGVIEEVSATKDGETVREVNDADSTLEVSCSLWKTPDQPPTQFSVISEGARKKYSNRGGDDLSEAQRQYGSPGRPLQTVAERNPEMEMRVDFDGCTSESEKALRFDCTSVTVEPEELRQGEDRIDDVQLEFADGSYESPPGTADEVDDGAFELPVTLAGTGENEGKVIDSLEFRVSDDLYRYRNLDVQNCSPQQDTGSDDDSRGSDSTGGETRPSEQTETPAEESTSQNSTESQNGGDSGGDSPEQSGSGGTTGSDPSGGTDTTTGSSNVTTNSTDENYTLSNTSSTNGTAAATNGSGDTGNGTANGSGDSALTDGTSSEDQPGMGFVTGIGGLLGVGELARRRLGIDEEE